MLSELGCVERFVREVVAFDVDAGYLRFSDGKTLYSLAYGENLLVGGCRNV